MSSQQQNRTVSLSDRFCALWDKIWWLVGLVVFGGGGALLITDRVALFLRILGGVLGLAGAGSLLHGLRALRLAHASEDWFPVDAVVVSSGVTTHTSTPDSHGQRITSYFPQIEYEYSFQGETHRSDRILFANVNYPRDEAEALVERHPVGARVTAFVDPRHPRMAVLEKGLTGSRRKYAIVFIVGSVLLAAGLIVWFLAPRLG